MLLRPREPLELLCSVQCAEQQSGMQILQGASLEVGSHMRTGPCLQNLKKLHRARQYNLQQNRKQATAGAPADSPSTSPQPPGASPPQPESAVRRILKRASFSTTNLKQLEGSPYASLADLAGADVPEPDHHQEASMLLDVDDLPPSPQASSSQLLQAYNPAASSSQLSADLPAAAPAAGPPGPAAPAVLESPQVALPPRGIQALPSFGRDLSRMSTNIGRRGTHDVGAGGVVSEALMEEVGTGQRCCCCACCACSLMPGWLAGWQHAPLLSMHWPHHAVHHIVLDYMLQYMTNRNALV
jgi:hypothetical protein